MAQQKITMGDLATLAENAADVLTQVRDRMMAPHPLKIAPTFTSVAIAELCGITRDQLKYLSQKQSLPAGEKVRGSRSKEYSLEDAITFVVALSSHPKRPSGMAGKVVSVCNYKGGVAKTSTAIAMAQAMTLRGYKVLVIDCDGQGTATQLCGISPEQHVDEEQTLMPLVHGDEVDCRYAVQPTYWHNLSVIPASSALLAAEFRLPSRAIQERGFRFWEVLEKGIEPLREDFDLIVIDTSPSLSHLTINAMIAADGLIMCCPPDALDFASSVQFWQIFSELMDTLPGATAKQYDFVTVVYTKVQINDVSRLVKTWMKQAYGAHVNAAEIPDSTAARMASAQIKTIYDLTKPDGSLEAYRRYKDPLDRLADYVMDQLAIAWDVGGEEIVSDQMQLTASEK